MTALMEKHDMDPAKKLTSAVCILHCINLPNVNLLYITHSAEKFLLPLAGMLSLHPGADVKAEYEQLCSKIPAETRYKYIFRFINITCITFILL